MRASSAGAAASASIRAFIAAPRAAPGWCWGWIAAACAKGIAFRVSAANARGTLRYLREREQVASVYREALVPVTLLSGEHPEVMALTFLVERAHPSYAGQLALAKQAHFIRGAVGRSGNNIDYLASTLAHLNQLGIRERELERLLGAGRQLRRARRRQRARAGERGSDGEGVRKASGASAAAEGRGRAAVLLSHGAEHAQGLSRGSGAGAARG